MVLHDARCKNSPPDSDIATGRYKLAQRDFHYLEANIDIAHHVKPSKSKIFHLVFFSRDFQHFLSGFYFAESRLPALARKSMKKTIFFPLDI